ncbi:MAG: dehydrogenase, partial [Labilithrix sp.]|nr:dehydrogenase [Labilithrix sp.]
MREKPDHGEESYRGYGRLTDRVALVIAYLEEHEDAKETERLVREAGRRAVLVYGDLADRSTCDRIIAAAVEAFGRIDILVNNAAYQGKSVERLEDIDDDRVEQAFRVNVIAMFHLVRRALPHMHEGGA